jgi:hypothetical protein
MAVGSQRRCAGCRKSRRSRALQSQRTRQYECLIGARGAGSSGFECLLLFELYVWRLDQIADGHAFARVVFGFRA